MTIDIKALARKHRDNYIRRFWGEGPRLPIVEAIEQAIVEALELAEAGRKKARRSDPITSHIGASAPQSGARKLVLDAVEQAGPEGITACELATIHGHRRGLHRRLPELERGGWIERRGTRTGESGVPNTVWVRTAQVNGPVL